MNDSINIEIFNQDLEYCIKTYENNKFDLMNIAANRLMENSIFLENKEIFLIAAILKDIANDYMGIFQNKTNILNSAKVLGKKIITSIKTNFYSGINIESLWQDFQEFTVKINEFQKDELEFEVYIENTEFTKIIFRKILEFLEKNKQSLKKIHCTLINGVLGVMVRIMKNHSCTLKETMVYLYFKLLSILNIYVIEKNYPEEIINEDDYKEYLEVHIDFIVKNYLDDSLDFKEYNLELWKIGKEYRELYFLFNPPKIVARTTVSEQIPAIVRVPITPSKILAKKEEKNEIVK
ncbi:hypothetical protein LCGC14_2680820 [marine sediment metagenome]|uniref:Uncharacterized protein n=1 Tax=marine sediment metagenome TaxID=412755 RepID=A0A0F9BW63_9ZZZZ